MSNPAVITLDNMSRRRGRFKRFVIEDNIGEAIHLHLDHMRMDFTVKEFLAFSAMVRESLDQIDFLRGYKASDFDVHFLRSCALFLPDLVDIKIEEARLADLRCVVPVRARRGRVFYRTVAVRDLPAYRFLQGDKSGLLDRDPYDYFTAHRERRLGEILAAFRAHGYPFGGRHIILFNGQEYIRYGEDEAAVLGYLHGFDATVKVMRFSFRGKGHLLRPLMSNMRQFFGRRLKP